MTALDLKDRPITDDDEVVEEDVPTKLDESGPRRPRWRPHLPPSINWPEAIITGLVVLFVCGFVFKYLEPSKLFLNTTPTGGDMGAHVWQPAYMRDHLLTHFRLTGWAPDWYAGFPSLVFYFPLPSLFIVILSEFLHYNVAFKLITVLGLVTLPFCAWFFGKMARFNFPGPACLAVATLPYLFSTNFTIYGGNIASTMAGEFGFSISLSVGLIVLGLVARGLETGKYRAWASLALVVTFMCHLLPGIFVVAGALVLTVMRWDRRSWRWMAPVFGVAAGLAAFWWIPFFVRLPYATNMGYQKVTQYWANLYAKQLWLLLLAVLGALVSFLRRQRLGIFLTIMAALSALVFRFAPQARLWNARVLPFWFICLYLLAGVAVAEGGAALLEPLKGGEVPRWSRLSTLALPVVVAVAAWIFLGFPLHGLPGGSTNAKTGKYDWLGFSSSASSFIPSWVNWNYSGYQSAGKTRRNEYFGLVATMEKVGQTDGCGRAMWEYEPEENDYGTPDALMLLPYWTHSCIGSMEGLYYESSATTPYHFLNAAELSLQPSDPVRGLDYPAAPNVAEGVQHLQLLGVKYYMALTPQTQMQADADPSLKLVATSGPWPVSYSSGPAVGVTSRTWKIYEISDSDLVAPLVNQPVVMKGLSIDGTLSKLYEGSTVDGTKWLTASEAWYLNPNVDDVMYAASGPKSWARIPSTSTDPPRKALPPVQVSDIVATDSSVSFNVDTIGVPVLVKVSYFPNWQAHGATGPYRVTPNLMVVIPTSHHVYLHYGNTPVDWFGYLLGILGLVALVWMVRADPVVYATGRRALGAPAPIAVGAAPAGPPPSFFLGQQGPMPMPNGPGVEDAYLRLQRELAVRQQMANGEIDDWLGFPAGLAAPDPASPGVFAAPELGPPGPLAVPELGPPGVFAAPELGPPGPLAAPDPAPPGLFAAPDPAPPSQLAAPDPAPAGLDASPGAAEADGAPDDVGQKPVGADIDVAWLGSEPSGGHEVATDTTGGADVGPASDDVDGRVGPEPTG